MSPVGYSGKSAANKLGLRSGVHLAVVGSDIAYTKLVGELPEGCVIVDLSETPDVVHLFVRSADEMRALAPDVIRNLKTEAALWVSWPKRSSRMHVDLTDVKVRDAILPSGWVDVKVCAVDQDWSALKFLLRKALR